MISYIIMEKRKEYPAQRVLYFMDVSIKVVTFLLISEAECKFRVSRQPDTWDSAHSQCQNFGGRLAILDRFEHFRDAMVDRESDIGLDIGSELWVAARLETGDWKWEGEISMEFKEEGNGYERRGCFHQQLWNSGSRLANVSPRSCLDHCQWSGIIGLKKDFCMCEAELVNISMVEFGVCHLPCDGSTSEMCGGLYGVSVYIPATKVVVWAEGEPRDDKNCVLVRKKAGPGAELEFVTADCSMQTRVLCSFRNDEKCGMFQTCLRWTSNQFTWDGAASSCQSLGGHLAEVDNSRREYFKDMKKIPTGTFWIALRRRAQWKWKNGEPINMLDFFGDERDLAPSRACAIVQNIGDNLGLGARSCKEKRYYLCQYDVPDEITGPVPGAQKASSTRGLGLTTHPPGTNSTLTTVTGNNGDKDQDDSSDSSMLTICMYSFLGFLSGMVVVLLVGSIVYCVFRCNAPDPKKHQQLQEKRRPHDNTSVSYSSRDGSVHIQSPPSDVTYDSVYDQGESPFRRTQRLIRMGSANSWRHAQSPKRQRSNTLDSALSDYTWRGMIGGKMEVINTQLRHPDLIQSQPRSIEGGTYELHNETGNRISGHRLSAECEVHRVDPDRRYHVKPSSLPGDITPDLDALEGYYSLPNTSETYPKRASNKSRPTSSEQRRSRPMSGSDNPMFLQIETKTDDQSNEENIYATIKKTFQRIQEEMKNEQAKDDERMMYTVPLN